MTLDNALATQLHGLDSSVEVNVTSYKKNQELEIDINNNAISIDGNLGKNVIEKGF